MDHKVVILKTWEEEPKTNASVPLFRSALHHRHDNSSSSPTTATTVTTTLTSSATTTNVLNSNNTHVTVDSAEVHFLTDDADGQVSDDDRDKGVYLLEPDNLQNGDKECEPLYDTLSGALVISSSVDEYLDNQQQLPAWAAAPAVSVRDGGEGCSSSFNGPCLSALQGIAQLDAHAILVVDPQAIDEPQDDTLALAKKQRELMAKYESCLGEPNGNRLSQALLHPKNLPDDFLTISPGLGVPPESRRDEPRLLYTQHLPSSHAVIAAIADVMRGLVHDHQTVLNESLECGLLTSSERDDLLCPSSTDFHEFDTVVVFDCPVERYLCFLAQESQVSPSTLLAALVLIDRVLAKVNADDVFRPRLEITQANILKLYATAVRVASKVLELCVVKHDTFAMAARVTSDSLQRLESRFLGPDMLDWDCHISPGLFAQYRDALLIPSPPQHNFISCENDEESTSNFVSKLRRITLLSC